MDLLIALGHCECRHTPAAGQIPALNAAVNLNIKQYGPTYGFDPIAEDNG